MRSRRPVARRDSGSGARYVFQGLRIRGLVGSIFVDFLSFVVFFLDLIGGLPRFGSLHPFA